MFKKRVMRAELDKIAAEQMSWEKVMKFRRATHITYSLVSNAMFLRRSSTAFYDYYGFRLAHAHLFGPILCFDLSFVRQQNPTKRRMAAAELLFCSTINRQLKAPFHLCFANADPTLGQEMRRFGSYDEGASLRFDLTTESYLNLFPKERLVLCKSSNRLCFEVSLLNILFQLCGGFVQ